MVKLYIDMIKKLITEAINDFKRDIFKLMINTVSWKTM